MAWRSPRPAIDGNKVNARFDESAREEEILAKRVHAITAAHGRGLAVKFKRLSSAVRQVEGAALDVLPVSRRR